MILHIIWVVMSIAATLGLCVIWMVAGFTILPSFLLLFLPSHWVFSAKHTQEYGSVYGLKTKQIHHWISYSYPNKEKTYWWGGELRGDPEEVARKHKEFDEWYAEAYPPSPN